MEHQFQRALCESLVDFTGGSVTKKYKTADLALYLMHMALSEPVAKIAEAFGFRPATVTILSQTVESWRLKDEALDNWLNAAEHGLVGLMRCKKIAQAINILPP